MAAADFRERLLAALGGPWPEPPPLRAEIAETRQLDGYRLERVTYLVEPEERVASLVLVPDGVDPAHPAPCVCVWHQHAGHYDIGKSEPAGLAGSPEHHTAVRLAREGYVTICPDALGFGERTPGRLRKGDLERHLFLRYVVAGKSLAWKNILDMRRAVDYVASRSEVRADRVGCYGHSMGSTHAWLVAPWEPRIAAVVGNCCLPTYAGIHREELLHCFPNFLPGLFAHGDTPDIVALIAPRPLHMNFGELDQGTPAADLPQAMATIERAYQAQHAEEKFTWFIEPKTGHVLSPAMWERTRAFFERYLNS